MTTTLAEERLAQRKAPLEAFLAAQAGAEAVDVVDARPLSGGAIQENWLLDLVVHGGPFGGKLEAVLRTDALSSVAVSRSRAEEFALLQVAQAAGVTVPEPLWLCEDPGVLGKVFYVMRRVAGTAAPHRLMKDRDLGGDRDKLAERLGAELARIHSVTPPRAELTFLGDPPADAAGAAIAHYRAHLDDLGGEFLALEWGLRWCELHKPAPQGPVLLHQDFRTGNYMVDRQGLTGVLDWEFCDWGDPMSDLGWFCAACWRYSQPELEAGGIDLARRDAFVATVKRRARSMPRPSPTGRSWPTSAGPSSPCSRASAPSAAARTPWSWRSPAASIRRPWKPRSCA